MDLGLRFAVTRIYAALLLILPFGICKANDQTVLLAADRSGRVEVLDPMTLESLGSIKALPQINGVSSDRSGVLFVRAGLAPEYVSCCALYAIDLKTHEITKLIEPTSGIALSPDGQHVLTQRGAVGVEAFSVSTLQQEPRIPRLVAPGVYSLSFSPDGRLLFGVSNFPASSLDIFDFYERNLVQRFTVPRDLVVLGTWVGDKFYLYGYRKGTRRLWRVNGDTSALEDPVKINFPDTAAECKMWSQEVFGSGNQLFLYERFGAKIDRRNGCTKSIPGGLLSIDPQSGAILAHLAPDLHFASLIPSTSGRELYGLDVRDTSWRSVGLVRLNARTGEVLAKRDLSSDVWFINIATIPSELVPSDPAGEAACSLTAY
jgi:hypothetical protein